MMGERKMLDKRIISMNWVLHLEVFRKILLPSLETLSFRIQDKRLIISVY